MDKLRGAMGFSKKTNLAGWEAIAQREEAAAEFASSHPSPDAAPPSVAANARASVTAAASRAAGFFSSLASNLGRGSSSASAGSEQATELSTFNSSSSAAHHMIPDGDLDPNASLDDAGPAPAAKQGDEEDVSFLSAVSTRVSAVASSAAGSLSDQLPELSYPQRVAGFVLALTGAAAMFFLAVSLLPALLLGGAAKFAFAYAFGSLFLLAAPCFLTGLTKQVETTCAPGRRGLAAVYLGSLVLVLCACVTTPTVFILLPLLLVQGAASVWYLLSFTPCGTGGLTSMTTSLTTATFGAVLPRGIAGRIGL